MQGIYYHSWLIYADLSHELLMFADAPWPGHGVLLGHLSLSAFVFEAGPAPFHIQYWVHVHRTHMAW